MKMRKMLLGATLTAAAAVGAEEYVSISGRVTDYRGKPVDSCAVLVSNPDFSTAYETMTNADGFYRIDSVARGSYANVCAMRPEEYPRQKAVKPEDMKLEFWAWNVIADRDLMLDLRYDKLELYGTTAFCEYGGRPEMFIYTRPMSVTKVLSYEDYMDKAAYEKHSKVTVEPEYMEFEVYVDGKKYDIISVQHLSLPNTNGNPVNDDCYLIQVPMPEDVHYRKDGNYEVRVVGHNTQYDEWGESVCYLRPFDYRWGEARK